MSNAKPAKEPSMEEILASIRQIISDDDGGAPAKEEVAPEEPADQDAIDAMLADAEAEMSADDVDALFDAPEEAEVEPEEDMGQDSIDDLMAAAEEPEVDDEEDEEDVLVLRPEEAPEPAMAEAVAEPEMVEPEDAPAEVFASEPLAQSPVVPAPVAPNASLLSDAASASIAASFGSLSSAMSVSPSGGSLEDIVKELLRPMLKEWLDSNLPPLVERMVQAEIERMRGPQ